MKNIGEEIIQAHFIVTPEAMPQEARILSMAAAVIRPATEQSPLTIDLPIVTQSGWVTVCERPSDLRMWTPFCVYVFGGVPTTLSWIADKFKIFEALRIVNYPEVKTPPFLRFPILGDTPWTAPVTAILDHHGREYVGGTSKSDKIIGTLVGYTFKTEPANVDIILPGSEGGAILARDNDGTFAVWRPPLIYPPFPFHYVGVSYQGGYLGIQYDNHTGYDFRYPIGVEVYAAALGETVVGGEFENGPAKTWVESQMRDYHALFIKHPNGYYTAYLHLSWIDPDYVDTTDPNNWKPKKAEVDIEKPIGKVGDKGSPGHPHLHFGLLRLDSNRLKYADPYGYYTMDGTRIHPPLWVQTP